MIQVNIELDRNDENHVNRLLDGLARMASAVGFARFARDRFRPYQRTVLAGGFAAEASPVGQPWAPLRPRTGWWRERGGFPPFHPINERTGQMKRFALDTYDLHVSRDPSNMEVTLDMPKAQRDPVMALKIQHAQQGGRSPQGAPFPARPILGFRPNARQVASQLAMTWMTQQIRALQ